MSLLGGSLLDQKQYAGAAPWLLHGYERMKAPEQQIRATSRSRLAEAGDPGIGRTCTVVCIHLIQKEVLGRGTFIPAREPVRLDYIWLRSDWACHLTHAEIVEELAGQEASDHRPVFAELEFPESSANRTRHRS